MDSGPLEIPANRVEVRPGTFVKVHELTYEIRQILDLETVLGRDTDSGRSRRLHIKELRPLASAHTPHEVSEVPDKDWKLAQERLAAILPLLKIAVRSEEDVEARAREVGVHPSSLYRWLRRYESTRTTAALVGHKAGRKPGSYQLDPDVEEVVRATIEDTYLSRRRPTVQHTYRVVADRCRRAGLKPPHANTIRRRIHALDNKVKTARRHGSREAAQIFEPRPGTFPDAEWPLAVVQIDHTKLDIILVDDVTRRPVGRPWITVAIDVYSRMVTGFSVSFDPPGSLAVGLCLSHSILPKEAWLVSRGLGGGWPVYGLPDKVHADNAKEFRGGTLQRACENWGIAIEWRPVATPHYGGHIERLLGTFNSEIHRLPGSTFSGPKDRGSYDSAGKAALTLSEFETWLTTFVVDVYHQREHSSLGMSPIQRFEQGVLGSPEAPGRGIPDRITDERRLRLDFMPAIERTVQTYGIALDGVHYYSDVLRPWIGAKDSNSRKRKRRFLVRRDPRDISTIYFYDPEVEDYFDIPYRNTSRPAISLWELREARRRLKEESRGQQDEDAIFDAYNRMRSIEESAVQETMAARRRKQRRRDHGTETSKPSSTEPDLEWPELDSEKIAPFDELEELP